MKSRKQKLLSIVLCLVMVVGLVPSVMFAAEPDTRTKVSSIIVTSNMGDVLKYNGANKRPTFTVEGGIVNFATTMGGWEKQNGDSWSRYDRTVFSEGTYRYRAQIRIDAPYGTTYVFDKAGVTATVNGVAWPTTTSLGIYDEYSYAWVLSPEYVVAKIAELPLNFTKNDNWDIGTNYANRAITSFSVAEGVIGGTKPYTFSKVSGPDWLTVANDGTVSGTPTAIGTNNNLVIKVTDSANNTKEITLSVANTKMNPADRTKVSSVTATSNIDDILKYSGTTSDPTFTVNGGTVYFYKSGGGWQKKDGDNWANYTGSVFTEGTYRYTSQIRIDVDEGTNGTTHVLDSAGVTTTVDGEKWTTSSRIQVGDTYSYTWVNSPEYTVSSSGTPAHTHSWEATWDNNSTHHWHNCSNADCDITDISAKNGYAEHQYSDDTDTTCNDCGYTRILATTTYIVSGTLTAYGDKINGVTIQLIEEGLTEPTYEINLVANSTAYEIENVLPATYTMKVSKAGCVTREYAITVDTSNLTQNILITVMGDVNMDGQIKSTDALMVQRNSIGSQELDSYQMKLANPNNDSNINTTDALWIQRKSIGL